MFRRLKRLLVESYIGAIALGILLADVILELVNVFVAPVAGWFSQNEYRAILRNGTSSRSFPYHDALPPLERFIILLLVWYLLLLLLYSTPVDSAVGEGTTIHPTRPSREES
jgi:hypothetical protein